MKYRAIIAGFAMLLFVASAFAVATPVAAAAAEEDVLYIAMQQDLPDFNNYNLGTNSVWKAHVIGYCYEGLVGVDYDLSTYELLAAPGGISFTESTLTVDVNLRQGVKFHDGTTMTADDVVYSYMMVRDGTTYSDRIIQAFDEDEDGTVDLTEFNNAVQKTGTYSVRFVMAKEYGQFFTSTLSVPIVPKALWDDPALGWTDSSDLVIVSKSDARMTIGTGPFLYDGGVPNSYRVVKTFSDYWGKDVVSGAGYPLFPNVIDTLYFKIYSSIDTAILALQGGDVDYIAWAVTAGRVPSLMSDPNIQLEYMSDSGYFYLAFNMKKEPMNNLTFRRAVSHLIDKDQIVDVYMGGFGQAGSAAVPPFFGEWHNQAVTKYPFDIDRAKELLDEAGYTDKNDDGWRDMPDGSLMDKITLLTPPADYDPIRIKAGEMISTNMRAAGINVEAKPIDFNTLVAKLTAFDYQMLELGWSFTGYTECVSLLFDIYGPKASSNSWAFWSTTNENPWYASLGGVSTLADAATQAYADEFYELEKDARESFNTSEQINLVKEGQAIIADSIPCNILYYRVNVEAHSKVWTNWTVFDGTLYNAFCLNVLDYAGAGGTSGGGAVTTDISAGLTLPGKVRSGETVEAAVIAIDGSGKPVEGATVEVNITGDGVVASPLSGETGANGWFMFDLTGAEIGESTVTVDLTFGTATASDSASIRTYTRGGLGVVVTPEKTSLAAGETMEVTCYVADADGPVEGAEVLIDKYLLGYGDIDPGTATTDADGIATFTYMAPEIDLDNQHMLVSISASVSKAGYLYKNVASAGVVVYNDADPDWMIVSVDSVSTTALDPVDNTATITVLLTDVTGDPIGGETLDVAYSDSSLVTDPVTEVTTETDGTAEVVVEMADTGESAALRVTVGKFTAANSIADTVTLTYVDPADPPADPMYGGYVQYAAPKFIEALGEVDLAIYVFDSEGNPAPDGTSASLLLEATSYGQLVDWDGSEYNTLWDYAGMNILTEADGQNIVSAGSFALNYVDWDFYGVELFGGVYEMTVYGIDLAHLDLAMSVYLCPDAWGTYSFDTWNYEIHGQTTISSTLGYGRSMAFTAVRYEIADPVLQAKADDFDTTTIDVWAYDESNDLVDGAMAAAYQAVRNAFGLSPTVGNVVQKIETGADGHASWDITAARYNVDTLAYDLVVDQTVPIMYVRAYVDGTISLLSQTQIVIEPIVRVAFAAFEPAAVPQPLGFAVMVSGTVVDLNGDPLAGLPVSVVASGGVPYNPDLMTDADGKVVVFVDPSGVSDAAAAFVGVELETGGMYEASSAKAMLAVFNTAPEISVSVPGTAGEVVGPNATVVGSVFDMNGLSEATLTVDSGTPIDLLAEDGAMSVAISRVLTGLAEGEHKVVVTATDSLGQESEVEVTFTLVAADEGDGDAETDYLPWIVAAIGWIVAAVILVLFLMKGKKQAGAEPMEEPADEPMEPEAGEKAE